MRFVVTGTGQSGTGYAAAVLTASKLPCGHEAVFNRWNPGFDTCPDLATDLYGDSSYAAVPFLDQLPPETVVVHLVRPALDVIRSVVGRRQLDNPKRWQWARFIDYHADVLRAPEGAQRAAAYWLRWNQLAERQADVCWRLGDLGPADVEDLADRIGADADPADVARAFDAIPTNHGTGPRAYVDLDDLGPFLDPVLNLSAAYNLPPSTPLESPPDDD